MYTYGALGRKVTATIGAVTTRFYYDGQRVIEERDAGDAVVRYHINGAQFVDEHIATYDVAKAGGKDDGRAAGWTYYLLNANYSVAGTGDASGTTIERLDYSASGDFAVGPAGTYAHDADADADIDLLDFANLQVCFGTTVPACLDIHDFDLDGQSNGVIDIDDFDGFAQCFNGPDFAPQPGCEVAPAKARGTTPETGMFTLHGRPIDVLPDGKVLMDFRTRIYDPQHGRWLQRDRAGYADGANLYESFRGNPSRFNDPEGKYTKLASGWNQGDDVVYQRFPWLWSSAPSDTFPVGRYYYHEGQKLVVYDDPFEEYAYVLSFEGVEQWSRGVHDSFDYRDFATKRGLRVDRTTGKVVKRSFSENLALWLEDEVAAHTIDIDFLDPVVFFAGPAFTTLTAETAPGLIVEDTRTVSRLEYGLAAGTSVLQVLPIAQLGTQSLGGGVSVAGRGGGAIVASDVAVVSTPRLATAGQPFVRIASSVPGRVLGEFSAVSPGPLADDIAATFSGGRYAVIELSEPLTIYRAWHPGGAREFGAFWCLERPLGSLPARIESASVPRWGNLASRVTEIRLPAGTTVYVGEVGSQGGLWVGGGSQVYLRLTVPEAWKVCERVLR